MGEFSLTAASRFFRASFSARVAASSFRVSSVA
jgi:hypothetical protein